MRKNNQRFDLTWWRAVGTMIGGVIGVGVFGLPYAFMKSGWSLGFLILLVLGFLILLLNLMYTEVVLQTPGRHRLVGYIKKYLGHQASRLMSLVFVPYAWGAMLAYLLIGGDFLHTLLSPLFGGQLIVYQLIIAVASAGLTFGGIKKLAKIEGVVVCALLFLFIFIILASFPSLEWSNLSPLHFNHWFVPYGVLFFALSGLGVIPEMKEVLGNQEKSKLPQAVFFGQILILALYAFFSLAVVGATGAFTTQAAFDGLVSIFGQTFAVVGSLLGVVTVISISSVVSVELQDVFQFDYKIPQKISWFLASLVPVIFLFFGFSRFVDLIGFLGGVLGGAIGILVVVMYKKMRQSGIYSTHHCLNVPNFVSWFLIAIFAGGIIQTILGL